MKRWILLLLALLVAAPVFAAVVDLSRMETQQSVQQSSSAQIDPFHFQKKQPALIDLGADENRGVEARLQFLPQEVAGEPVAAGEGMQPFIAQAQFHQRHKDADLLIGDVAIRIYDQNGKILITQRLKTQGARWQVPVVINPQQELRIELGTRLQDRKKRIFSYYFLPAAQTVQR